MKNQLKNYFKIGILFLGVSILLWNCDSEDVNMDETTIIEKTQNKNSATDHQKINFLKKGLRGRIMLYNKSRNQNNQFIRKFGRLDGKNIVTIKFPKIGDDFMVAIPFKHDDKKLLIAYYKNGKRTYKILRKKKYNKKNISKTETAFLDNIGLLFRLTYNNSTRKAMAKNCHANIVYHDYANCEILYQDSCSGHMWVVSTLGKDETCGGELDEVIVTGDNDNDESEDPDDDDPYNDYDPYNEEDSTDEDCFEYDCEEDEYDEDTYEESSIVIISPDNPISDMVDYLKCFDTSQNTTITVYVSQPIANSSASHDGTFVGHTFVSISQGNEVSVFGFYPATENVVPIFNSSDPSAMGDDSNDPYDVSMSSTISGNTLQQIINYSTNYNSTYDLNTYNCSDFAIEVGNLAGMNLPDANGSWPGGSGSNPGALGQHIRGVTPTSNITTNTTGGNAPSTNKGC